MDHCKSHTRPWQPLAPEHLDNISKIFSDLFPVADHNDLAKRISDYWIRKLQSVWDKKSNAIKQKDLAFCPDDPLSRIRQNTMVIAYADSVFEKNKTTLLTLDKFLNRQFPAIGGLHILPACMVAENRFNDGYFSQIVRNKIHPAFGTNEIFSDMAEKYFSMADFVLNHVDVDNPQFQSFLNGDDSAGKCFYIFSEAEYQKRLADGDFDKIFRPRPFPLFSIFRKTPKDRQYAEMNFNARIKEMNKHLAPERLPDAVIALLSVFNKIKNDQMLQKTDYACITQFRQHLEQKTSIKPETLFTRSQTQETRHPPYIFKATIQTKKDLLVAIGYDPAIAQKIAGEFDKHNTAVFGEEIRALTTFSHVQVDLNTSTFEGLKTLADDFGWYLSMDLNMLRLDAANFAFKRWKTSCFGLPEVTHLMKILYLSMDSVAPRIVANLEVNDKLSTILKQMADKDAPPPMMYDFHLASLLPVVVNSQNTQIAARIFDLIREYDIPKQSIRFSIAESHDGKSVRGSLDLLTPAERQCLARIVAQNGGKIKSKGGAHGREPYELCTSTRGALIRLNDPRMEADRFLAFYTMAFALMGRHVKSIYFNDLIGLENDYARVKKTGELRDIKRTKSDITELENMLRNPASIHCNIARGINNLIALVDTDPALSFRGNEAAMIPTNNPVIACIHNHYNDHHTFTVISLSDADESAIIDFSGSDVNVPKTLLNQFTQLSVEIYDQKLNLKLKPFERLWLKKETVKIPREKLVT